MCLRFGLYLETAAVTRRSLTRVPLRCMAHSVVIVIRHVVVVGQELNGSCVGKLVLHGSGVTALVVTDISPVPTGGAECAAVGTAAHRIIIEHGSGVVLFVVFNRSQYSFKLFVLK